VHLCAVRSKKQSHGQEKTCQEEGQKGRQEKEVSNASALPFDLLHPDTGHPIGVVHKTPRLRPGVFILSANARAGKNGAGVSRENSLGAG
jgi:hypothetical protein